MADGGKKLTRYQQAEVDRDRELIVGTGVPCESCSDLQFFQCMRPETAPRYQSSFKSEIGCLRWKNYVNRLDNGTPI